MHLLHRKCKSTCLLFLILLNLLLAACSNTRIYYAPDPEGTRRFQIAALSAQLESAGVQVVKIGETLRIILPSDYLFNPPASTNINPNYSAVLDTVAKLMLIVEIPSGAAAGYTNSEPSPRLNKAVSERQAQVVLDYLWGRGVDVRVFHAVGYGSSEPLAGDPGYWINRRIEIKFMYMPLTQGGQNCPVNMPLVSSGRRSTVQCYDSDYDRYLKALKCEFINGIQVCQLKTP